MYALDERTAESLTGLGKSRLETLEHHFLSQIKSLHLSTTHELKTRGLAKAQVD